jgi:hypothetical protein
MSSDTGSRWLPRIIAILIIAALCPLLAFAYRLALNVAPDRVPGPEPIYTIVPAVGEFGIVTPQPAEVVVVVPNGWSEYPVPENGFAISVPTTWQQLPVKAMELEAALQAVRETNPELAGALGVNAPTLIQNGVKFWAYDLTPESVQGAFATNLTVTRQILPNPVSFDTFVTVNLNQLNALETRNSNIVSDRTSIAGLPAERIRYLLTLDAGDGAPVTTAILQYLVLNGRNAYVLTFATRTDLIGQYNEVFEQSASSLRFIGQ